MEATKIILHDKDLLMCLWAEATRTTVYVHNCTRQKVLRNKTIEGDFSGEKQEVNHLRIFGFPVYIHIPKEKRTNLDPSRSKGIFVGYNETLKAFRIYFPRFKKVDISRDVTFDEGSSYTKKRKLPTEEIN